jgi:glyoxylase-like metal-dependent hydrolase (beta-lactamase superfamily II)
VTSSSRRARASVESKLWGLERALVLGGDAAAATTAVDDATKKAQAKGRLSEDDAAAFARRRARLADAFATGDAAVQAYAGEHGLGGTRLTTTNQGARVLRLVAETLPGHVNYVYVVEIGGERVLFDVGTGMMDSRADLLAGMQVAKIAHGFDVRPEDIDVVFVSHGHIDHFGDAAWWKRTTGAPVWVHELDARVLENFRERAVLTGRDMRAWLGGVGLPRDEVDALVDMYLSGKDAFEHTGVDRRLQHGDVLFAGRGRVIHTPGHCPGHVCLRVDDALLVGDQVLTPITPHITPQALNPHNGLERYLFGLARLLREQGVRHVLPAHYEPIEDLHARIMGCAEDHVDKLRRTVVACGAGATIAEVAEALFGKQEGYAVLLALLEAGTHVEYLHQLGALVVDDLERIVLDPEAPIRYRATETAGETTDRAGHAMVGGG